MRSLALLLAATALPLAGQTPASCQEHRRYGRLPQAEQCFAALVRSANPYFRAEG